MKIQKLRDGASLPNFLKLLCFVEMWERFSYYGMRSLLVLFLVTKLGFEDKSAYAIYSLFASICYIGPIFGGIIADKFLGFRRMIVIGGVIIIIGHLILGLIFLDHNLIFLGLGFIAIGTGFFKGNITNLLGACYLTEKEKRDQGFYLFYVSVNIGSFLSVMICSFLAVKYGFHYGFLASAFAMISGLTVFLKFQKILGSIGNVSAGKACKSISSMTVIGGVVFSIVASIVLYYHAYFTNFLQFFSLIIVLIFAYVISKLPKDERRNMIILAIFLLFFMCFFGIEMQLGSLFVLFTERNIDNHIFGSIIPASISQSINPLSIILTGFLINRFFTLTKKHAVLRFGSAFILLTICFLILYLGCLNANLIGKVNYLYLLTSLTLMGIGELMIGSFINSVTTLLAPARIRGFVMGFSMLSLAFANFAGIIISKFMSVNPGKTNNDILESLKIYQDGFLKIMVFSAILCIIYFAIYPYLNNNYLKNQES